MGGGVDAPERGTGAEVLSVSLWADEVIQVSVVVVRANPPCFAGVGRRGREDGIIAPSRGTIYYAIIKRACV